MGSVCDSCFGSENNKPSGNKTLKKLTSFRQTSVSTHQLTDNDYSGYGSQYDASVHKREEHLPPVWNINRPRFGSDESGDSRGSGKADRGSPGGSAAGVDGGAKTAKGKLFSRKAKITRQVSIDNEAPVRKLSRTKSRVR